jgi:hypothetical protein
MKEAWLGQGEIKFHDVSWENAPMSSHIIKTLGKLPVVQYQAGIVTRGSQDLLIEKQYSME